MSQPKEQVIRSRYVKTIAAMGFALFSASVLAQQPEPDTFGDAVAMVNQHSPLIVLSDTEGKASIAVWPAMQGRVLTSSAEGPTGRSFGWINHDLIASGKVQEHINTVGGEDRLWLGPEGGQFSIFFAKGAPFDLDHWYTPAPIDTEPFDVVKQSPTSINFRKNIRLRNYSGNEFNVQIDREVRLLSESQVWGHLGDKAMPGVKVVGYESENKLTNLSATPWSKSTGILSLWVLGQFRSTPGTTIVLPIRPGDDAKLGIPVTRDYFGKVPDDRITVRPSVVLFKADANFRSKLGIGPLRAMGVSGSYDADHHVLTIVQYSIPAHPAEYVNSAWKIQPDPFKGDVANCYNDGPPAPGKPQLGRFYELESSSPAEVLASHASVSHIHRTIHLQGPDKQLDIVAKANLGVTLEEVNSAFHE